MKDSEKPSEEQKFKIPEEFLERLGEFSYGGFILTLINENGEPEIYHYYDSVITALGLQKHLRQWLDATEEINHDLTMQSMVIDHNFFVGDDASEDGEEENSF